MSNYKVTEKDLIKDLKEFPIEIVEKMIEYQVKQGNAPDVTIFQQYAAADVSQSGFRWSDTKEGSKFWCEIIHNKQFSVFFTKYPKRRHFVYIVQDGTKDGKDIINTLIKYGGVDILKFNGESTNGIYYIKPDDNIIRITHLNSSEFPFIKTFYTEIQPESSVKEFTMQEIADKLGINVNELRIKK